MIDTDLAGDLDAIVTDGWQAGFFKDRFGSGDGPDHPHRTLSLTHEILLLAHCRSLGEKLDQPKRCGICHNRPNEIARYAPPPTKIPLAAVHRGHGAPLFAASVQEVGWRDIYRTSVRSKTATQGFEGTFLGTPQQGQDPIPAGNWRSRHQLLLLSGEVVGQESRAARLDGFKIAPHLDPQARDRAQSPAVTVAERKLYRRGAPVNERLR